MAWELVAEGPVITLFNLGQYENELPEGSYNLLQLALRLPVSEGIAQMLEDKLRVAGVENIRVETASPMLRIYFTKGFPWLAVMAAIILASLVIIALVISWKLVTYIAEVAPAAIPIMAIAVVAAITVVGVYLVKRR